MHAPRDPRQERVGRPEQVWSARELSRQGGFIETAGIRPILGGVFGELINFGLSVRKNAGVCSQNG